MKSIFIIFLFLSTQLRSQTCTALYSYGANFEVVHFFNQSVSANAHYYWNFGDGTSSKLKDPIHEFPENGNYLVTLYVNDLISNCSNYYEQWLSIIKNSSIICSPQISDSIYFLNGKYYLKFLDFSTNCGNYNVDYDVFSFSGPQIGTVGLALYPANYLACKYFYLNNVLKRAAYKTCPNNYDRSKNYQNCSANFEFSIVSEDSSGQTIFFQAMNKSAASYKWMITGFGDPIYAYTDTTSIYYPGYINSTFLNFANLVVLTTVGQTGCKDSLIQPVVVRRKSATYVGIKNLSNEDLKIELFPNPVQNKTTLQFDQSKITLDKLSVVNTLGQTVFVLDKPHEKEEIDLRFLSTGIYYLKVENKEGQKVFKVVKE